MAAIAPASPRRKQGAGAWPRPHAGGWESCSRGAVLQQLGAEVGGGQLQAVGHLARRCLKHRTNASEQTWQIQA